MADPFIAEIRIFAGNFAPRNWAFCDGQILPIPQNTALFALIGTTYGGDGRTTLGLPNLQGRAPMHHGRGPGLTPRSLGQKGGAETATLTAQQLTPHTHQANGNDGLGEETAPGGRFVARAPGRGTNVYGSGTPDTPFNELAPTGGGGAHNNMQPYLTLNFIIALVGTFPSRS